VPHDHPLRAIRRLVDECCVELFLLASRGACTLLGSAGRAIAPEQLPCGPSCSRSCYTIRSRAPADGAASTTTCFLRLVRLPWNMD